MKVTFTSPQLHLLFWEWPWAWTRKIPPVSSQARVDELDHIPMISLISFTPHKVVPQFVS
jgi:hypothetical protein